MPNIIYWKDDHFEIANPDIEPMDITTEEFVATAGQQVFNLTLGSYAINSGRLNVYLFGLKQNPEAYNELTSTSFEMVIPLDEGTRVLAEYYQVDPSIKGDTGVVPGHEWSGTSLRFQLPNLLWGDYVDLIGPTPDYEWSGTSIRFKNPNGTWGGWINLKGDPGNPLQDHAALHGTGGDDELTPAMIGAAPINSPTFTGTPAAPTAAVDTNTTQIATTAFVQAAIASSKLEFTVINDDYTASIGDNLFCDTTLGAFTITLPSNPNNNDSIYIADAKGTFDDYPLYIYGNGKKIMNDNQLLEVDVLNSAFRLIYNTTLDDWRII